MNTKLDTRRIIILGFAFGIAWLTALILYLNGGLAHSHQIAPGVSWHLYFYPPLTCGHGLG